MSLPQACFIRVEVKKRELVSRADLAIEMVKRGVPVILGECYNPKELLALGIDKGYFFGKCAQPDTLKKFKLLLDHGWTFGALDEEGLLPDSLESFASQRFSIEGAEIFKDIFFFGGKQKETFDRTFSPRDSFVVSGNPRIDMWQANYYGLHDQAIQDIKKKYGKFALIPLNLGYYTISHLHAMSTYGPELAEKSEFLFDRFCKLAERLAMDGRVNVIMRPHPSDDIHRIKKLMIKHGVKSNLVQCIGTNEAYPWIAAAEVLFHNCCTTALEAGFCGTPAVTFAPSKIALYKDNEVNNLFPVIETIEDALCILTQAKKNFISFSDFRSLIDNWGRLSLEQSGQTASFIADRITMRNNFDPFKDSKQLVRQVDFTRLKREIIAGLSSLIGKNDRKVFLNKFPRTSLEEIKNIIEHICRYRGYKKLPNITFINSRLFALY